jgi:hypothetical protein
MLTKSASGNGPAYRRALAIVVALASAKAEMRSRGLFSPSVPTLCWAIVGERREPGVVA